MDERDYGIGAQILRELGVTKIKLITNNPKKRVGLMGYGLEIVDNVPIEIIPNPHNERYLKTKRDKLGHTILKNTKMIHRTDICDKHVPALNRDVDFIGCKHFLYSE